VTLHSFGGCGLALEDANELVRKIKMNRKAATRWTRTKVLIVDEGELGTTCSELTISVHGRRRAVRQVQQGRPHPEEEDGQAVWWHPDYRHWRLLPAPARH